MKPWTVTLRYPQDIVLLNKDFETAVDENHSTTRRFMPAGTKFKAVGRVGHHEPSTVVEFEDQFWSIG